MTFRIFNENTHIVAVRTTGNVFSYEVSAAKQQWDCLNHTCSLTHSTIEVIATSHATKQQWDCLQIVNIIRHGLNAMAFWLPKYDIKPSGLSPHLQTRAVTSSLDQGCHPIFPAPAARSVCLQCLLLALQAVERLNLKPAFFKDLLTDEPFTRKDLITIQDPTNLDKFNLTNFFHLKKNLKVLDEGENYREASVLLGLL